MALGDWISGLFQSEQTRGLSGGSAPSIALDDANPYYNYRLRRHRAEGDLISDPALLWYTSPFVKQRSGLGTHVASEIGDGQANYTDVLIVLSRAEKTEVPPDVPAAEVTNYLSEFRLWKSVHFEWLSAERTAHPQSVFSWRYYQPEPSDPIQHFPRVPTIRGATIRGAEGQGVWEVLPIRKTV